MCSIIALRKTGNERLGSNYTVKFSKATMCREKKNGERGSIAGNHLRSEIRGLPNLRKERKTKPKAGAVRPQVAWRLAKDVLKLKKGEKRYVVLSCRILGNAGTLFEKARRETFRDRLWSFHAHVLVRRT